MRQKVLIASALIHRPEVLFLDEPLDGLDANAAMVVKEVLKRLAGQGRTILFCSHILDVVERMCTRIVIINTGRQIADGQRRIRATTGGHARGSLQCAHRRPRQHAASKPSRLERA
jgi:ABC-2 type transport system ATP-binding protein